MANNKKEFHGNLKEMQYKIFSWKILLISFLITSIFHMYASSYAKSRGMYSPQNMTWTFFWVYLSIYSWKFWRWKALLPIPLYLITSIFFAYIFISAGMDAYSTYIGVMIICNIGGLLILYMLIRKSQKQAIPQKVKYQNSDDTIKNSYKTKKTFTHEKINEPRQGIQHSINPDNEKKLNNSLDESMDEVQDEDSVYEQAYEELESESVKKSTWAKAFAEAEGDENKARAFYIKNRVESLKKEMSR